jgi:polyisoprenoid-binding protein YceI
MGIKEMIARKYLQHAAAGQSSPGMSWRQSIDFAAAMLGVTDRHIEIDSARAMVHGTWTQLGCHHTLDISFNEIVALVNTDQGQPASSQPQVSIGKPSCGPAAGLNTSPP